MNKYILVLSTTLGLIIGVGFLSMINSVNVVLTDVDNISKNVIQVESEQIPSQEVDLEQKEKASNSNKLIDLSDELVVLLYGPIGYNGLEIANVIKKAAQKGERIWLLIDSPGGSVLTGAQIISAIEAAGVEVNTVCLTICASMGALIHQHGTNRYMVDRSILMFHEASGGVSGTVPQMLSQLNTMNKYIDKMLLRVSKRSKMSYKELHSKLGAELWIDAEDSLDQGFSDATIGVSFDESKALNPPMQTLFPALNPSKTMNITF